jgi:hypothetical protein
MRMATRWWTCPYLTNSECLPLPLVSVPPSSIDTRNESRRCHSWDHCEHTTTLARDHRIHRALTRLLPTGGEFVPTDLPAAVIVAAFGTSNLAATMRSSVLLTVPLLLALALVSLTLAPVSGGSAASSRSLNSRALAAAQSDPADMPEAVRLFRAAFVAERRTLRARRRELRDQLDKEFEEREEAGEEQEDEAEESTKVASLRAEIRMSKAAMSEFLNNQGVSEMRQSHFNKARKLLKQALHLTPDNANAQGNLAEVNKLAKSTARRAEDDEEDRPRRKSKKSKKNKRKNKKGKSKKRKSQKRRDDEDEEEEVKEDSKAKETKSDKPADDVYDRPSKRRPQREPEAKPEQDAKRKKRPTALDRVRRPNTNDNKKFPRVHIAHLNFPENEIYASGRSVARGRASDDGYA